MNLIALQSLVTDISRDLDISGEVKASVEMQQDESRMYKLVIEVRRKGESPSLPRHAELKRD